MKPIKLFLFIVLFALAPISQAQSESSSNLTISSPIDALIVGDWLLKKTDHIDGYNIYSDTNRFTSWPDRETKTSFTRDSLINYRDSTIRFYYRVNNYAYAIEYDSVQRKYHLKLYQGKKKRRQEMESFEIVKCTPDELVIRSYQYANNGMLSNSFSLVYTYRKKGKFSTSIDLLQGKWFSCSEINRSFFSEDKEHTLLFFRSKTDSICRQMNEHVDLEVKKKNYQNIVSVLYADKYSGLFIDYTYSIAVDKNLIYLGEKEPRVYKIDILNAEKLVLIFDKERTNQLR